MLRSCVSRSTRLQNKVIDIEVAKQTASPTVDPSVHVALVGHSMGGIIAAETLILLASEQPIPAPSHLSSTKSEDDTQEVGENTFMFPRVQGLLAFDTPFLGIAPGVVSFAAENHHKTATAAYGTLSDVANVFGWGGDKKDAKPGGENNNSRARSASYSAKQDSLGTTGSASEDAAATPSWQRWGRYAMFAGAAGAVAAGGAAALYAQRDRFSAGWDWATSHLEFVGCLGRFEDLRGRVRSISRLQKERGIGCANLYTCLGKGAVDVSAADSTSMNATAGAASFSHPRSDMRTFCSLPGDVKRNPSPNPDSKIPSDSDNAKELDSANGAMEMAWIKSVNSKAADETKAHLAMFMPADNPEFYELAQTARDLVAEWVDNSWYETSGDRVPDDSAGTGGEDKPDGEFMDSDDVVVLS